jgi:predicted  nucleic acid-binding Zn-ribbon protein
LEEAMITVEWLKSQIETVARELRGAREREAAAKELLDKAVQEHGNAMEEYNHLEELLSALERELEFERGRK